VESNSREVTGRGWRLLALLNNDPPDGSGLRVEVAMYSLLRKASRGGVLGVGCSVGPNLQQQQALYFVWQQLLGTDHLWDKLLSCRLRQTVRRGGSRLPLLLGQHICYQTPLTLGDFSSFKTSLSVFFLTFL